ARRAALAAGEQRMKVAEYKATETATRSESAATAAAAATADLGLDDPAGLKRAIDTELEALETRIAEVAAHLQSIGAEPNPAIEKANASLELARRAGSGSKEVHPSAAAAVDQARATLNARIGERDVLAAQLTAMDRAGAEALVKSRELEVASFPADLAVPDGGLAKAEARVAAARRELEQAKEDLHKSEGALSKVGGASVREEVQRVDEALVGARAKEKELEVDADAWKLLLDTLRDVENEEGAHLGRALAGPVTTKFDELTAG